MYYSELKMTEELSIKNMFFNFKSVINFLKFVTFIVNVATGKVGYMQTVD